VRIVVASGLGGLLLACYWLTLREVAHRWGTDPQYSHGYLVPLFAVVLLWLRRHRLAKATWQTSWWGVLLLAVGAGLHVGGAYFYYEWLDALSLLPSLAGVCLLFGGWQALRWAWPGVVFLAFMLPLPYQVETALSQPLQRLATLSSTYILVMLGFPAIAEGNTIILDDHRIGVVEACSGLSMLVTFFALSTAMTLVIRRRFLERLIILASAVPIGLVANVVRIVVTAILIQTVGGEEASAFFHDGAGWVMMPLALGILWIELWVLSHLFVEREPSAPAQIDLAALAGARRRQRVPQAEVPVA
jgi:exosortase